MGIPGLHRDYDDNLSPARRQSRDQYRLRRWQIFNALPTDAVHAHELIEFDDGLGIVTDSGYGITPLQPGASLYCCTA
jgi:hypothetical protein